MTSHLEQYRDLEVTLADCLMPQPFGAGGRHRVRVGVGKSYGCNLDIKQCGIHEKCQHIPVVALTI